MDNSFGKFYAKTFTGSMMGAGSHVIALMAYAVSHAKPPDGEVEINPALAAYQIGDSVERIEQALAYLQAADPQSRSKGEEGRRLVRMGEYRYRLVNWLAHREGTDVEAQHRYWRKKQAEYRSRRARKGAGSREQIVERLRREGKDAEADRIEEMVGV